MRPTSCIVGSKICVVFSMTTDKGIFIQNIYYLGGDGKYYLDPATAAAMQP